MSENHNSVVDEMLWITFPAIDYLEKNIKSDFKVFEYGGGGSTLFFLNRCNEVVTAEHDVPWFKILKEKVSEKKYQGWTGVLVEAEEKTSTTTDFANPDNYLSDDNAFKNHSFRRYASSIDHFPDQYFDLVLVDGRSRPSCMKHAIPKVKKGGLLILDNADRTYYLQQIDPLLAGSFKLVLDKIAPVPYNGGFSQTNIWVNQ